MDEEVTKMLQDEEKIDIELIDNMRKKVKLDYHKRTATLLKQPLS